MPQSASFRFTSSGGRQLICLETAAARGTSHVTTKQRCKYTTSLEIQNALWKATVTHVEWHATKAQWACLRAESSYTESDHHHLKTRSRRDREEEGELGSHEEVRLPFAGPGEIERKEVVLDPHESPGEIKSREMELGSEFWTTFLLQLFLNSCATDIVFVTLLRTAVETANYLVH